MARYEGINCSKCGRWVGKDGFIDVSMEEYNGSALELGYSLCKRCLDAKIPRSSERGARQYVWDQEAEINTRRNGQLPRDKSRGFLARDSLNEEKIFDVYASLIRKFGSKRVKLAEEELRRRGIPNE